MPSVSLMVKIITGHCGEVLGVTALECWVHIPLLLLLPSVTKTKLHSAMSAALCRPVLVTRLTFPLPELFLRTRGTA